MIVYKQLFNLIVRCSNPCILINKNEKFDEKEVRTKFIFFDPFLQQMESYYKDSGKKVIFIDSMTFNFFSNSSDDFIYNLFYISLALYLGYGSSKIKSCDQLDLVLRDFVDYQIRFQQKNLIFIIQDIEKLPIEINWLINSWVKEYDCSIIASCRKFPLEFPSTEKNKYYCDYGSSLSDMMTIYKLPNFNLIKNQDGIDYESQQACLVINTIKRIKVSICLLEQDLSLLSVERSEWEQNGYLYKFQEFFDFEESYIRTLKDFVHGSLIEI
jgi:hypothetical protein